MEPQTALQVVTPPAIEPVSLAEAKLHCRVDISDDDAWFTTAIVAARRDFEQRSKRALITRTLRYHLSRFPTTCDDADQAIVLPQPRLLTITSITYKDADGADQVLDPSEYEADAVSEPGRVLPAHTKSWPEHLERVNSVRVQYTAGYGAAASDVDDRAKQAIKLCVAHWYRNRETVLVGTISKELEFSVNALADQLWHGRLP